MTTNEKIPGGDSLAPHQLRRLSVAELTERYLSLQYAYQRAVANVDTQRQELAAIRERALQNVRIADLARKINIADLNHIVHVVKDDFREWFDSPASTLLLVEDDGTVQVAYSSIALPETTPLSMENDGDVFAVHMIRAAGDPLIVSDWNDYCRQTETSLRPHPTDILLEQGALLVPFGANFEGGTVKAQGAVIFGHKPAGFTRVDVELGVIAAEMLSKAICSARELRRMSVLAGTDDMTGLDNHRVFQKNLDQLLIKVRRYGPPLSLALIDIDHFKNVNDRFGHPFGDVVLQKVAQLIKSTVREVDITARYGGEEFAVIMPCTSLTGAALLAERVRGRVEAARIGNAELQVRIRVSIGIASYQHEESKESLIKRVDQALYRAKNNGRNRVEMAEGEVGYQRSIVT